MKSIFHSVAAIAALTSAITFCSPSPDASSENFVVTNNNNVYIDNTGTVLKLEDMRAKPQIKALATLQTGVADAGGGPGPNIQIMRAGADICVFLSDPEYNSNEITSFKYPELTRVGSYSDPNLADSHIGISMAGRGRYLIAVYLGLLDGNNLPSIDTWKIDSGCTLTLVAAYVPATPAGAPALTPDGKTLVVAFAGDNGPVDSFSIGPNGVLEAHASQFTGSVSANASDITQDGKYVIFALTPQYPLENTELAIFPIESDGSLGKIELFDNLGPGIGTDSVWLSPDEKFIYVIDNTNLLTTLNFTENPLSVTYSGCLTTLRTLGNSFYPGQMATVLPSGSGAGLYVAEAGNPRGAIGLLSIDPTSGCTTEVPDSPFPTGSGGDLGSIASWPPRPF